MELSVVTGAFSYTGKYITKRLFAHGASVATLTGHPNRPHPFGEKVRALPFNFDNPAALADSLEEANCLYNTYWVRFDYGRDTFDHAVKNTVTLFNAAKAAGVSRVVHLSITNPSEDSPLPYFRGKAVVEKALMQSGLSYAIVRPTVIFGPEDILINNIAYLLRKSPVFAIPGKGDYKIQPVYVDDVAKICVEAGGQTRNVVVDAVGPELYTYEALVRLIADTIGRGVRIVHVSPGVALVLSRLVGFFLNDVILTRDEIKGLMANLLVSNSPPTAITRFSEWLRKNAASLGVRYASELARHYLSS
jgi:NADH dehydrogenase